MSLLASRARRTTTGLVGIAEQAIPFTDFPLPEIKLYVEGGPEQPVLLLPSEH